MSDRHLDGDVLQKAIAFLACLLIFPRRDMAILEFQVSLKCYNVLNYCPTFNTYAE